MPKVEEDEESMSIGSFITLLRQCNVFDKHFTRGDAELAVLTACKRRSTHGVLSGSLSDPCEN